MPRGAAERTSFAKRRLLAGNPESVHPLPVGGRKNARREGGRNRAVRMGGGVQRAVGAQGFRATRKPVLSDQLFGAEEARLEDVQ